MTKLVNIDQKKGISLLLLTKLFERFAFYIIVAILIEHLTDYLNNDGAKVGLYYSIFYGSIGITSIFSGLLGDLTNRMKVTKVGIILTAVSYLLIILLPDTFTLFFTVLVILGISIGLTIPNTIVFLGNLFNEKNNQIYGLSGFILFSLAIGISVLLTPYMADYLKLKMEIKSIYIIALIFSLISLTFFMFFEKKYKSLDLVSEKKHEKTTDKYNNINTIILVSIIFISIILKIVLGQRTLTFNFFVREHVENEFGLIENLDKIRDFLSVILLIIFSGIIISIKNFNWKKVFVVIILGAIIGAFAYFLIVISDTSIIKESFVFSIFILLIISETLIYPTISYTVYRSSPKKFKGLFQGIFYIFGYQLLFLGAILYENASLEMTFLIFSLIFLLCAGLIFGLAYIIKRKEVEIMKKPITSN